MLQYRCDVGHTARIRAIYWKNSNILYLKMRKIDIRAGKMEIAVYGQILRVKLKIIKSHVKMKMKRACGRRSAADWSCREGVTQIHHDSYWRRWSCFRLSHPTVASYVNAHPLPHFYS